MATNFQDLVAKVKNLVALAPVLGAILRPELGNFSNRELKQTTTAMGTSPNKRFIEQALDVRRLDNAIHQINRYPVYKY